jgi:hypothetical protein
MTIQPRNIGGRRVYVNTTPNVTRNLEIHVLNYTAGHFLRGCEFALSVIGIDGVGILESYREGDNNYFFQPDFLGIIRTFFIAPAHTHRGHLAVHAYNSSLRRGDEPTGCVARAISPLSIRVHGPMIFTLAAVPVVENVATTPNDISNQTNPDNETSTWQINGSIGMGNSSTPAATARGVPLTGTVGGQYGGSRQHYTGPVHTLRSYTTTTRPREIGIQELTLRQLGHQ